MDLIHLYIPYYIIVYILIIYYYTIIWVPWMEQGRDKEMWEKKRRRGSWVWRVGREDGGVDGTGKMRGKREGETDSLETGQAMLGARFC